MPKSGLRVLFMPDYASGNPYQRKLATSLARFGATVAMKGCTGLLPMLGAVHAVRQPDVLHLHWIHPYLMSTSRLRSLVKGFRFLVELALLRLLGVRIVWTIHNLLSHECRYPRLETGLKQILFRLCDGFIVHCRSAREIVVDFYRVPHRLENNIHTIPHGHYIDSYVNDVSRRESRKRLDLESEQLVFLYFGSIRPYKGVFQLFESFQELEESQARLLIAGRPRDDITRTQLAACCDKDSRIESYLRFIADDQVQVFMNAADVVVLPYHDVLTSGAVILAMSFGKPVIAPRLGCMCDVLDDRGSFLYDPSDENALLQAMRLALHADLAQMGKQNRELAEQLQWDEIGRRTYELYQECLSR